ncbi:kinase-like domain-containing protein [Camillea tinctor]|nr:kinase-like domain-containing protein [Camillea tinctor]
MSLTPVPERLPTTPEEISSTWLSTVLDQDVQHFEVTYTLLNQTAGKVFATITYKDGKQDNVCLKGSFNPSMMAMEGYSEILSAMYTREAGFFVHVAPELTAMRLPRVLWAGANTEQGQAIVIMEDLRKKGYKFGSAVEAWPVDRVKAGVEQLAALHAGTWNTSMEEFPWLTPNYEEVVIGLAEAWDRVVLGPDRPPVPDIIKDKQRTVNAMKKHHATKNPRFLCLVHGDPHSGNTFIDQDGNPNFLDWQTAHISSAFHDFAYFVVGALSVDDRRQHERSVLSYYLEKLYEYGGPALTADDEEVMEEYKKCIMSGMGWIMTPYEMQRKEAVIAMVERYSTAITDHKVIELVESLPYPLQSF